MLGTLKTEKLERIVIDGSHIDQKKRGIFDMKEVYAPLLKLLTPDRADRPSRAGAKVRRGHAIAVGHHHGKSNFWCGEKVDESILPCCTK